MRGETLAEFDRLKDYCISIHSPHARGDAPPSSGGQARAVFQSTPLMRGETASATAASAATSDFNPLPSCEGRRLRQHGGLAPIPFQSTPLMRGETAMSSVLKYRWTEFQSTPLMRGETGGISTMPPAAAISIHSPHARGDNDLRNVLRIQAISIHSPHARGDVGGQIQVEPVLFQSTPLMRGET